MLHETPAPSQEDLGEILTQIHKRVLRYLQRRHMLQEGEFRPVAGEEDRALAGLASAALMGPRTIGAKAAAWITHLGRDPHAELTFARGKHSAALHGFSLYAGPRIDPCSRHRIEKLVRYIVRPPIATPRLSLTSSGKVLYKLKRPFKDGTHSVLMEPLAFLERLCALIPRPRRHLLTYHGALAPASALRASIIPCPTEERCVHSTLATREGDKTSEASGPPKKRARSNPYIPWSDLMRRVFEQDTLQCPGCGGRRSIIAFLDDPIVVHKMLRHLGLEGRPRPPPIEGQQELF